MLHNIGELTSERTAYRDISEAFFLRCEICYVKAAELPSSAHEIIACEYPRTFYTMYFELIKYTLAGVARAIDAYGLFACRKPFP